MRAFAVCGYIFKEITSVSAKQRNFIEKACLNAALVMIFKWNNHLGYNNNKNNDFEGPKQAVIN